LDNFLKLGRKNFGEVGNKIKEATTFQTLEPIK